MNIMLKYYSFKIIPFFLWVCISSLPVTLGFNPTRHPKMFARSPTIAVNNPIIPRETKKHGHPPHIPAGGIKAKMICKKIEKLYNHFFKKSRYVFIWQNL